MNRTLRAAALTIVTAFALAGCMKVEMNIALNEDDTANADFVFAVEEGLGAMLEMTDQEVADELFGDVASEFPDGRVEPYNQDGFIGSRVIANDQPLSDLNLEDENLSITRDGDDYVVSGVFEGITDMGDMGELPATASMTLAVTFPGEVSEYNGELEGTTVTWNLLSPPDELQARGSASAGGDFPLWIILVAGAVIGIGIGIAVVFAVRRKPATVPAGGAVVPGAPAPGEPSPVAFDGDATTGAFEPTPDTAATTVDVEGDPLVGEPSEPLDDAGEAPEVSPADDEEQRPS